MIKVLYGPDTFTSHAALEELRREIVTGDPIGGDVTEIDGATAQPEDVLNAAQTMPLLGGQRLVVVSGLLRRFGGPIGPRKRKTAKPKTKAKKKAEDDGRLGKWQSVVEALPQVPKSTTLVFVDGPATPGNPMLAALKRVAGVVIIPFPQFDLRDQKGELAAWIRERAELYGARLEGRAIAAMADLIGSDLWTIDSELRKLATYADDEVVTEALVRELVSQVREANAFAMVDAIVEGRTQDAVRLLKQLIADGDSPLRLLSLVARQYRMLIIAHELQARNVRQSDMGKSLGTQSPWAVEKVLKQLRLYTLEQLRAAYRRLLEADLSIKRGIYDPQTAFEVLIFDLAAAAASRSGRPGYNRPPTGRAPARSGAARRRSGSG